MEAVESLSAKALVGKFTGKVVSRDSPIKLKEVGWQKLLGYCLRFHILVKGWLCFECNSGKDVEKILSKAWLWGPSSLVLKKWMPKFDPCTEPFVAQHVWVLLLGFPLELWSKMVFVSIVDSICKFVFIDECSFAQEHKGHKALVELDLSRGFLPEVEISWNTHTFVQSLDYWKIPFKCAIRQEVGHLMKDCSMPLTNPRW